MRRSPQIASGVSFVCLVSLAAAGSGCRNNDSRVSEPPPAEGPAFFDDFTDGDRGQWEAIAGEWEFRQATPLAEYGARGRQYALTVAGNTMWKDYQVDARVTVYDDRGGDVGVAGRVQGSHFYYELLLGRDERGHKRWSIRQQRRHAWDTLASGPIAYDEGVPYTLRFVLEGRTLEGYFSRDDGRSFERLGTALTTPDGEWGLGKVGLVTYGGTASFHAVSVTERQPDEIVQAATIAASPWGALVTLRDNTATFAGRPSGGWYVTPIHVNLRANDGKVLVTGFGRKAQANCSGTTQRQVGETWLLDPAVLVTPPAGNNLNVTPINEQSADAVHEVMYCAGHVTLPDGRIFYSAGTRYPSTLPNSSPELGLAYGRIFTPSTGAFTRISVNMKGGQSATPGMKWYPTNMAMPDGRVLMFGGFHYSSGGTGSKTNLSLELFDPAIWDANHSADPYTVLTNHSEGQPETPPTRGYTNLLLLPKPVPAGSVGGLARSVAVAGGVGKVFLFNHEPGPSGAARLFARPNALTINPSTTEKGEGASGLVMPDGRLLFANGGHDGPGSAKVYFYNPYSDAWTSLALGVSRIYSDAIWLADGSVLLINGYVSEPGNVNDVTNPQGDVRTPQILDPFAGTFTTQPAWPEPTGRGYHAVALLLKDGRVLVGGGKDDNHATGCEKNELRVYDPPYLSAGPRPTIQAPQGQTMVIGGTVPLTFSFTGTLRATRGVALLRTGSLTHGFDQGQRYVPLTWAPGSNPGTIDITPPADPNIAPPGDYLLFLVSDQGVPSTGVHFRLVAPPRCVYAVDGQAHSYLEAEGRSRQTGPFTTTSGDPTRSGGAYLTVTEGSGNHTTVPDEGKVLWFDATVTRGGSFSLWALANAPDTSSDSFWISVDGGPDTQLTIPAQVGWTWASLGSALTLSSGTHTLKVKVREDGVLLDKLLLTASAAFVPQGLGNTALACNGSSGLVRPQGVTATAGDGQVSLSWTASSGATSYTVKGGTASGVYDLFTQTGITGTSYTRTGLANGSQVFLVVSASNAGGESPDSAEVSATPAPGGPPAPSISSLVVNDNLPAGCAPGACNRDKWSVQAGLQVGATVFGDRTYTLDSVPAGGSGLLGKPWIRTAADSKSYTVNPLATFGFTGSFVTLLVDNRHNDASGKPVFLDASWVDQGYDVVIRQSSTATFPYSVWRKAVATGTTVSLPAVGTTAAPCYFVVVQ
jgi:hypothetical protein